MNMNEVKQHLSDKYQITVLRDMTGPVDLNAINGKTVAIASQVFHYTGGAFDELEFAIAIADVLIVRGDLKHFAFYELDDVQGKLRFGAL